MSLNPDAGKRLEYRETVLPLDKPLPDPVDRGFVASKKFIEESNELLDIRGYCPVCRKRTITQSVVETLNNYLVQPYMVNKCSRCNYEKTDMPPMHPELKIPINSASAVLHCLAAEMQYDQFGTVFASQKLKPMGRSNYDILWLFYEKQRSLFENIVKKN